MINKILVFASLLVLLLADSTLAISTEDHNLLQDFEAHLFLSAHVYEIENLQKNGEEIIGVQPFVDRWAEGSNWTLVSYRDTPVNGFTAALYKNDSSKTLMVSFGGTSGGSEDLQDILQDLSMINKVASVGQFTEAKQFIADAETEKSRYTGYEIEFTGHSLGGALAQFAGLDTGYPAVTFNTAPYSLSGDVYNLLSANGQQNCNRPCPHIINIRAVNDYVSALAMTIGIIPMRQDLAIKTINGTIHNLASLKSGHTLSQMIREYDERYIAYFGKSSIATELYKKYSIFITDSGHLAVSVGETIVESYLEVEGPLTSAVKSLALLSYDEAETLLLTTLDTLSSSTTSLANTYGLSLDTFSEPTLLNTSLSASAAIITILKSMHYVEGSGKITFNSDNIPLFETLISNMEAELFDATALSNKILTRLDEQILFYGDNPELKKYLENCKTRELSNLDDLTHTKAVKILGLKSLPVAGRVLDLYFLKDSVDNIVNKIEENKQISVFDGLDIAANLIAFTPIGAVGSGLYQIEKEINNALVITNDINDIYRDTIWSIQDTYFQQYHTLARRGFLGKDKDSFIELYKKQREGLRNQILYTKKEIEDSFILFGKAATLQTLDNAYSLFSPDKEATIVAKQSAIYDKNYQYYLERQKAIAELDYYQSIKTFGRKIDISKRETDTGGNTTSKVIFNLPPAATLQDLHLTGTAGDQITFFSGQSPTKMLECIFDTVSTDAVFQLRYYDPSSVGSPPPTQSLTLALDRNTNTFSFALPANEIVLMDMTYTLPAHQDPSGTERLYIFTFPETFEIVHTQSEVSGTTELVATRYNTDLFLDSYSTAATDDSGYILAGNVESTVFGDLGMWTNLDPRIVKYNSSGALVWEITPTDIDTDYFQHQFNLQTRFYQIIKDTNDFIVLGTTNMFQDPNNMQGNPENKKIFIIRIDSAGNVLHKKIIDRDYGPGSISPTLLKSPSGFYLAGEKDYEWAAEDESDILLFKLDAAFNVVWEKSLHYGGSNRNVHLAMHTDNLLVALTVWDPMNGSSSRVVEINSNGDILSTITPNCTLSEMYWLADDEYLIGGFDPVVGKRMFARVNSSFEYIWQHHYDQTILQANAHLFDYQTVGSIGVMASTQYPAGIPTTFITAIDLATGDIISETSTGDDNYNYFSKGFAVIDNTLVNFSMRVPRTGTTLNKEIVISEFTYPNLSPSKSIYLQGENYPDYTVVQGPFVKEWYFSEDISGYDLAIVSNTYSNALSVADFTQQGNTLSVSLTPQTTAAVNKIVLQLKENTTPITVSGSQSFWAITKTNHAPKLADGQITQLVSALGATAFVDIQTHDDDGDPVVLTIEDDGGGDVGFVANEPTRLFASFNDGEIAHTILVGLDDGKEKITVQFNALQFSSNSIESFYSDVETDGAAYSFSGIAFGTLKGVVWGQPDPNDSTKRIFRPQDDASLAETLKIIINAGKKAGLLQLETISAYRDIYPQWARPYYTFAVAEEALDDEISDLARVYPSREVVAKIIVKTFSLQDKAEQLPDSAAGSEPNWSFIDEDAFSSPTMHEYGKIVHDFGIFMTDDLANPQHKVSRAELATVIEKIFMIPQASLNLTPDAIEFGQATTATLENISAQAIDPGFNLYDTQDQLQWTLLATKRTLPNPITAESLSLSTHTIFAMLDNQGVKNVIAQPLTILFSDQDNDGVQDQLDNWITDPRYASDNNSNGIPDNLDTIYNLASYTAGDVITINGQQIAINDIVANGGFVSDYDGDTIPDDEDDDIDGDGVPNQSDAFPINADESVDSDLDGIGNNADTDDDNDTMPDTWEIQYGLNPLSADDAAIDTDNDGFTNVEEFLRNTPPIVLPGDLNWDDTLSLADVIIGIKILSGEETSIGSLSADSDGDMVIGLPDVLYIVQSVAN